MKKICSVMCLALISIFFVVYANAQNSNPATIDLANIPQNIEGIGSLTLVLEESLKPSSLSEEWMQGRAAWRESVKTSREIVDMRNLIYKLELNLQYISQSEEWRNFRAEWLGKIKAVSEIKELAKLLVQLEQNLRWTAQNDTWRQQRENWIKAANKISGDTQIPGKIEDQDHLLSSAVKKMANLILELEKKIKYQAQPNEWREVRKTWKEKIDSASAVGEVSELLEILNKHMKDEFMAQVWVTGLKEKWVKKLKNTQSIKEIGLLLVEFERAIKWTGHYPSWWTMREGWIQKVNQISGATEVPVKFDTTSPAAQNSVLNKLAEYLINFADNIKANFFSETWQTERSEWMREVLNCNTNQIFSSKILQLRKALKENAFTAKWKEKYDKWLSALNSNPNDKTIASLIIEFEQAVLWESHTNEWRDVRSEWYKEVLKLAGMSENVPSKLEDSSTQTTPVARTDNQELIKTIREIANLVFELERDLIYKEKIKAWRFEWIKNIISANNIKDLGGYIHALESKFPYDSQSPVWKSKRPAWSNQIKNPSSVAELISALLECERSFLWKTHSQSWRNLRANWIARLNKLRGSNETLLKLEESPSESSVAVNAEIQKIAEKILDFENSLASSSLSYNWSNQRLEWTKNTIRCSTFFALAKQLKILEQSLSDSALLQSWKTRKTAWIASLDNIDDKVKIYKAVIELEKNINWNAHQKNWLFLRYNWYVEFNSISGVDEIPDKLIELPQTEIKSLEKLVVLLLELERGIKSDSFKTEWKTLRSAWVIRLFNARSIQYLSNQVFELLSHLADSSFVQKWNELKNTWKDGIQKSNSTRNLSGFILMVERAIKWTSHNDEWSFKRSKWLDNINEVRGESGNSDKYN